MILDENIFDDVVEIEIPDVEFNQNPIEATELAKSDMTGEDVGIASLLLSAISDSASTIDNYNVMKANLTNTDLINVLDEIIKEENVTLGKLQFMLQQVDPAAENIMTGAISAENIINTPESKAYFNGISEDLTVKNLANESLKEAFDEFSNQHINNVKLYVKHALEHNPNTYAILYGYKYKNEPIVEISPEEVKSKEELETKLDKLYKSRKNSKASDFLIYVIYRNDFNKFLKESLNEENNEVRTIGIYGDEVEGFSSLNSLVNYFKGKGLEVTDVDGDMDYGWEMNLTGNPRKLFFAVVNTIPGYNSDSVQDFIDEYSIDESLNEGRWDDFDPDKWEQDMSALKDRISHSIHTVVNKYGKFSDSTLQKAYDVAVDCRNTFSQLVDWMRGHLDDINESLNEECELAWQEFNKSDRVVSKRKTFKDKASMEKFIDKLTEKDNFYKILASRCDESLNEDEDPQHYFIVYDEDSEPMNTFFGTEDQLIKTFDQFPRKYSYKIVPKDEAIRTYKELCVKYDAEDMWIDESLNESIDSDIISKIKEATLKARRANKQRLETLKEVKNILGSNGKDFDKIADTADTQEEYDEFCKLYDDYLYAVKQLNTSYFQVDSILKTYNDIEESISEKLPVELAPEETFDDIDDDWDKWEVESSMDDWDSDEDYYTDTFEGLKESKKSFTPLQVGTSDYQKPNSNELRIESNEVTNIPDELIDDDF